MSNSPRIAVLADEVVDLRLPAGLAQERISEIVVRDLATLHSQSRAFENPEGPRDIVAVQSAAVRPVFGERVDRRVHEVDADLLQQR